MTARLLSLRERGARVHAVELQPDGIDTDALADLLRGNSIPPTPAVRPKLAHIIPNFQNPAGYTLSPAKRQALLALAAEHNFWVFEGHRMSICVQRRNAADDAVDGPPSTSCTTSSFSKTCARASASATSSGRPSRSRRWRSWRRTHTSRRAWVAQSIVYEFCASGALDGSIRDRQDRACTARTDAASRRCGASCRRPSSWRRKAGYFMWVTLSPRARMCTRCTRPPASAGSRFVKGTGDFVNSRAGREHTAARLFGSDARADR